MAWKAILVTTVLLAACTDVGADAAVDYDGSENGTQSDQADCDSDGRLTGSGDVRDGRLTIRLTDDQGQVLFEDTYTGDIELGSADVSGHSGTWTLSAVRSSDDLVGDPFDGEYVFRLDC